MKNIFSNIIICIIVILIIVVSSIFGLIIWQEISNVQSLLEPELVKTIIADNPEININEINQVQNDQNALNSLSDININNLDNNNASIDYENSINRYFYNQLEEHSKIIYDTMDKNKENMKSGNYKLELGNSFSSILSSDNGQELLGKYFQSAIEAYIYDHTDVFYLSPNKMYLNVETITRGSNISYNVFINSSDKPNYFIDEFSSKAQVNEAISKIEKVRDEIISKKTNDTYQNIKMVNDYLVDNVTYDTSLAKANIYNIYGTLINGEAVCEGYARSFKYLMDHLEIPSVLVIGKATNSEGNSENHAWNYVELNGKWYAIDTTWNDPISNTGWVSQSAKYRYFLKGSNEMSKDHTPSGQFTEGGKVFVYPNIEVGNY